MKFKLNRWTLILGAVALYGCGKMGGMNAGNLFNGGGGNTNNVIDMAGHGIKAITYKFKADNLSEKNEDSLGQSVGVALTSHYGVYDNVRIEKYVQHVGYAVAVGSTNPGGNFIFAVLDTDEVNAFSGPNGYVFITRGAVMRMQDEAELAGVLAHEIAHVCHHDGLHQVQAAQRQGAFKELVAASPAKQFGAVADTTVDAITKTGYTQPQEFDADKDGVKFMTAAGYDPNSFLHFLHALQQSEANGGGQLMSTHPGISERVKRVSDEIAGMNITKGATLADRFNKNVTKN